MAVVVSAAPVLVDSLIQSSAAVIGGGSSWSILRDLNTRFQQSASPDLRQPLRALMGQMTLGEAGSDRGIAPAHLARTLIDVIERLHPLVESLQQDRLITAKEQLADFARPANTTTPASGVFTRRQILDRKAMGDLADRQLTEAKLIAGDGALRDAVDTLARLEETRSRMKEHARKLCELEPEFSNVTPIGSVPGRLDFVQAALAPVTDVSDRIGLVLRDSADIRTALGEATGDLEAAERAVQELAGRRGKVDSLRKVIQKLMRSEIPQILLQLHRTELERKDDERGINDKTLHSYQYHLSELKRHLHAARRLMELGLGILQKFSEIGVMRRQLTCPFPVELEKVLNKELLAWVVGDGMELKLNERKVKANEPLWLVPGPVESLWQVVVNLVNNARQAMGGKGKLTVSVLQLELSDVEVVKSNHHYATGTGPAGDYVLVSVRDRGTGFPHDALPRLFDFFSPANTGYGLAVLRQLVEDMGGFIGVDSGMGEPHGTTFHVYLPRVG